MAALHRPYPPDVFDRLVRAEPGHWWFRARNRLLLWVLRHRVPAFTSFLEIGCGTGFVLEAVWRAFPGVRVAGSEFFEEGLRHARARVPGASLRQLDARQLDDVSAFDLIGAFDVLEHIEEDELVLGRIARALAPGGSLVLTVPQHAWLWSPMDEYACHVRRYARRELVRKVRAAGLDVTYATSFVSLLLPLMIASRVRMSRRPSDPAAEFLVPAWLNVALESVMRVEGWLVRCGARLPAGGSLLVVGRKPQALPASPVQ